jgi:hypothetical protein
MLDHQAEDAIAERLGEIKDYYDARKAQYDADPAGVSYKPLRPDALYLDAERMASARAGHSGRPPRARQAPLEAPAGLPHRGFLADAGDVVVHADHGIGRFVGLKTIEAAGAPHDCLESIMPAATSSSCRSRTSSF